MRAVEFRPAAAAEVEDAALWYESKRRGLGAEFLAAVRVAIRSIGEAPQQYPEIYRRTRRTLLRRFPYGFYYRVVDERVVIVACMHGRREPKRWRSRA